MERHWPGPSPTPIPHPLPRTPAADTSQDVFLKAPTAQEWVLNSWQPSARALRSRSPGSRQR